MAIDCLFRYDNRFLKDINHVKIMVKPWALVMKYVSGGEKYWTIE